MPRKAFAAPGNLVAVAAKLFALKNNGFGTPRRHHAKELLAVAEGRGSFERGEKVDECWRKLRAPDF